MYDRATICPLFRHKIVCLRGVFFLICGGVGVTLCCFLKILRILMVLKMQKIYVSNTFLEEIGNCYNTLAFSQSKQRTSLAADLQNAFENFAGKF